MRPASVIFPLALATAQTLHLGEPPATEPCRRVEEVVLELVEDASEGARRRERAERVRRGERGVGGDVLNPGNDLGDEPGDGSRNRLGRRGRADDDSALEALGEGEADLR
ncbi:hypothetical protein DFH06DRAFT_1246276 [Mycena polygramma]|nr:hypothetical protein DFH06DRAFT_1246276 [Mycena polygramma]